MSTSFVKRLGFWWVPALLLSFLLDRRVFAWIASLWWQPAGLLFAYLGSFIFFVVIIVVIVATFLWHDRKDFILPYLLSFFIAFWLGLILKNLFAVERPYVEFGLLPLVPEQGFSFPSLHTVTAFTLLPLMIYQNKRIVRLWLAFSVLIAFSRLYLQVHYLSDVILGAFIGYEVSAYFLWLEQKYRLFSRFQQLFDTTLEIRRQLFHTIFGIILVFLYRAYLVTADTLFILLVLSLLLVLMLKKYKQPSFLYRALALFEREKHLDRFPARGILFFLLGAWLAVVLFPDNVALAAIMILAFGDSVTNIIGRYFGKIPIWYNKRKNWEGIWAGIFFGTVGASFLVPLWIAFVAATGAMLVESFSFKIGSFELDDNVVIPLVAGLIMIMLL